MEEEGRKTAERKEQLAVQEELEKRTAADLQVRIDGLDKELKEIGESLDRCAEQYRKQVEEKKALEGEISSAAHLLREVEQRRDNLCSRREIVKEMDAEHAGFFQGVKEILKARDRGAGELAGVRGAVAQLIRVPESYEAAIETALGGAMQYLVVEDEQTGRNGIRFLKERRAGRATFLPLDVIRERLLPTREREILNGLPGVVGVSRRTGGDGSRLSHSRPRYFRPGDCGPDSGRCQYHRPPNVLQISCGHAGGGCGQPRRIHVGGKPAKKSGQPVGALPAGGKIGPRNQNSPGGAETGRGSSPGDPPTDGGTGRPDG